MRAPGRSRLRSDPLGAIGTERSTTTGRPRPDDHDGGPGVTAGGHEERERGTGHAPDPAGGAATAPPGAAIGTGASPADPVGGPALDDGPDDPTPAPGWIRRLSGYCWVHRRNVLISLIASLAGMGVMALLPLIIKVIIDDVIVGDGPGLAGWIGLLLAAACVVYVLTFLRRYYGGRLGLDVQHDLRTAMFGSIMRLDGRRQDELSTGQVVGRATSDLQLIQGLLFMLPMTIGNFMLFLVSLIVMVALSPALTLIALAVAPALWWIARRSRLRLFPATWWAQGRAGEVAGVVDGAVGGVRVVKGFGQEEQEDHKLREAGRRLFAGRMRTVRLNARYTPALQVVPSLGQVAMLAVGGWLAVRGDITLGTFVAFSTYLAMLVGPVRMLTVILTVGQQARAGVERVLELIDARPEIAERPDARPLPADAPASVELDAVTFGYRAEGADRPGPPALRELTLRVEPGETLAVVGTSGSGKSTIAQLLPRFYDPDTGSVRVGGHDLRELTLASLRDAIGLVPENPFLFSDTLRANVAYARPDATDAELRAAARVARADGFIRALPDGWDTVVGEQGLTLSGGQRQRIALARAVLSDPRLLILDDATSAVDARVEHEIHEALNEVMAGRTTILIAHRRSTLLLADRIAVLDAGRLVDVGTREELEERCPLYRALIADPESLAGTERDPAGLAESEAGTGAAGATYREPAPTGVTAELWRRPDDRTTGTPEGERPGLSPGAAVPSPGAGGGFAAAMAGAPA
ncbi:ATP-binding cassette domain-containing protein, partial [Streptomyces sp. IF17]|nr:ATP-binding cassette domain-containing protein [Streptomyces alkaliphilus]